MSLTHRSVCLYCQLGTCFTHCFFLLFFYSFISFIPTIVSINTRTLERLQELLFYCFHCWFWTSTYWLGISIHTFSSKLSCGTNLNYPFLFLGQHNKSAKNRNDRILGSIGKRVYCIYEKKESRTASKETEKVWLSTQAVEKHIE